MGRRTTKKDQHNDITGRSCLFFHEGRSQIIPHVSRNNLCLNVPFCPSRVFFRRERGLGGRRHLGMSCSTRRDSLRAPRRSLVGTSIFDQTFVSNNERSSYRRNGSFLSFSFLSCLAKNITESRSKRKRARERSQRVEQVISTHQRPPNPLFGRKHEGPTWHFSTKILTS